MKEKKRIVGVYLTESLAEQVQQLADKERRSFSGEVVYLIERGLERVWQKELIYSGQKQIGLNIEAFK